MESNNSILKVGFWFGQNRPVCNNDEFLTYDFDFENIVEDYKKFESQYTKFKKVNPNPTVPYQDLLLNEECLIFFHDTEPQCSTFQEIYLMMKQFEKIAMEQEKLKSELTSLNNSRFEVMEEVFNNPSYDCEKISINNILTPNQIDIVTSIYNKDTNPSHFEKNLRKYLKSIKGDLNKKGIHYKYLTYALSYSLLKEVA